MDPLLTLAVTVARLEERLHAADDMEESRQETMRLVIQDAVRDAVEPLTARVTELESNVRFVKWLGGIATMLAPLVSWLLPRLVALVPIMILMGSRGLPDAKTERHTGTYAILPESDTHGGP